MLHPGGFDFSGLPSLNAFTQRYVAPSPAAFCPSLSLFSEASFLRVTLTHFALSGYKRAFSFQPFSFPDWPNLDFTGSFGNSAFTHPQETFSLPLFETNFPSA